MSTYFNSTADMVGFWFFGLVSKSAKADRSSICHPITVDLHIPPFLDGLLPLAGSSSDSYYCSYIAG